MRGYNERATEQAQADGTEPALLKQRGASSVDLPPQLMKSFFTPLFE